MSTNDPRAKPYDPYTDPTSDLNTGQWDKYLAQVQAGEVFEIQDYRKNSITLNAGPGGEEMIRISQDGFYVRGERVPADEKEAAAVYEAFKEFLTWMQLTRS